MSRARFADSAVITVVSLAARASAVSMIEITGGYVTNVVTAVEMPAFLPPIVNLAHAVGKYDAIPLPPEIAPVGAVDWDALTDEEILAIPAHVVVHMMRTAAQNGMQVISPRQVPSTTILKRVAQNSAAPFIHVVGSDAHTHQAWPVPAGYAAPDYDDLDDEPLGKIGAPIAIRTPAKSEPLVRIADDVACPIQRAWIKARAVVDLQNREGVAGAGDKLARAYEALWGVPEGTLTEDPGVMINLSGSLQDLAITTDNVLAKQLASVQTRRVVSVAVGASSAGAFGPYRAFDWTCARVTAEAKYCLTVSCENLSLVATSVSGQSAVGTLLSSWMNRPPNVIVYHPTPATAWSYAPDTFAVFPADHDMIPRVPPSDLVLAELNAGTAFASPVSAALAYEASVAWVETRVDRQLLNTEDEFIGMASTVAAAAFGVTSIGRDAGKNLKAEVYAAITSASPVVMAKVVRAITTVRDTLDAMPDVLWSDEDVVTSLAKRFIQLDAHVNAHMCAAAMARQENPEDWFRTLVSQLPAVLREGRASTKGWASIAVHFLLRPPDASWRALLAAVKYKTRSLMVPPSAYSGMNRVEEATDHYEAIRPRLKAITGYARETFSASYDGAALGSTLCARMADKAGLPMLAKAFRVNSLGWTFRQRFFLRAYATVGPPTTGAIAGTRKTLIPGDGRIPNVEVSVRVAPAYVHRAWAVAVEKVVGFRANHSTALVTTGSVTSTVRMAPPVRPGFTETPWGTSEGAVWMNLDSLKYAWDPCVLAAACERSIADLTADAIGTVEVYLRDAAALATAPPDPALGRVRVTESGVEAPTVDEGYIAQLIEEAKEAGSEKSGWTFLSQIDPDEATFVIEAAEESEAVLQVLSSTHYDLEEFARALDFAMESAAIVSYGDPDALY